MDKDSIFDDILKEKAQNEKFILPESLNLKIKSTLNNLPERKKKSKTLMKGAIAATIMLLCGIGIITANPALARNLPVVSSVFQFLSEINVIDKDYVKYSSDLNMSKTYNGITVTINNIVYDGIDLNIGYTVQSEKDLKETPVMIGPSIKVNGKTVSSGGGAGGKFTNKKTYIGVRTIDMSYDYLPKEHRKDIVGGNVTIPNNFIMDFTINDLSENIKGKWDFKFKVSNEKIKANVKSVKPNIDLSSVSPGLKVNELLITPINTAIRTSKTENSSSNESYIVFDDKGRVLKAKGGSASGSPDSNTYYSQMLYRNVYEDSKSLTFIPYIISEEDFPKQKNKPTAEEVKSADKEVPLNLNGITILSEGKMGEYKVTRIDFLNDKTLLHYECTKFISILFPYTIDIIDSNGKKYSLDEHLDQNLVKEVDPLNHKYIAQLPALNKNNQYKLKAQDYEKKYTLREDMKFTVKIK